MYYVPGKHGFNKYRAINISGFLAEFGYGKYLIVPFWYASAVYQAPFGLAMAGILARLRLAKIRTMARPNSPDMTPKRTKKVRLGIRTKKKKAVLQLPRFQKVYCRCIFLRGEFAL